ncbi:putative Gelsolin [Blattamonas nauphoetae]|uniref:Gelsolin n=1 Tax=Blattamonas nauphoetae TaxID=2049346 RepID=A0ABQ9YLR8_9EUKA|nr:putative Gelsolin [Blattamonas nauphoetae]
MASPQHVTSDEFKGFGDKLGLTIWRIEDFKPVLIPEAEYGKFQNGDSYIVLNGKLSRGNRISFEIFYWIGDKSTADEYGACAYKVVELSDALNGFVPQYRIVQNYESQAFLSLFPDGFEIIDGDVISGFKKTEVAGYTPKLYHLKGSRNVRVRRVDLASSNLNHGDCFVLDVADKLFIWNGNESSKKEKAKGIDVANRIRVQEKASSGDVILLEDGKNDESEDAAEFWELLGPKSDVKSAEEGGDDTAFEKEAESQIALYKLDSDFTEVAKAPLNAKLLQTEGIFLVSTGQEVFVWVGRKAPLEQKKECMIAATQFLAKQRLPPHTLISRIAETSETQLFKECFAGKLVQQKQVITDRKKLTGAEQTIPRDLKEDQATVLVIKAGQGSPVPADHFGFFYEGESYVVGLQYRSKNLARSFVFMWQGKGSDQTQIGQSAYVCKDLAAKYPLPMQVRLVQGKENADFLLTFPEGFVVRKGKMPADNSAATACPSVSLFKCTQAGGVGRCFELDPVCSELNSRDSFFVVADGKVLIWHGKNTNDIKREYAKKVGARFGPISEIEEGSESEDFFALLGGRTEYAQTDEVEIDLPDPRLFHCSDASGVFVCDELFNFNQDDLISDDVMILDAYDQIWVWIGLGCNENEIAKSMEVAEEYLEKKPDGREKDQVPVMQVKEGEEPETFTQHFPTWTKKDSSTYVDPYQKRLSQLQVETGGGRIMGLTALKSAPRKEAGATAAAPSQGPSVQLKSTGKLPTESAAPAPTKAPVDPANDPTKKEARLSDEEFQKTFGMDREAFYKQPKWKQDDQKKKHNLF